MQRSIRSALFVGFSGIFVTYALCGVVLLLKELAILGELEFVSIFSFLSVNGVIATGIVATYVAPRSAFMLGIVTTLMGAFVYGAVIGNVELLRSNYDSVVYMSPVLLAIMGTIWGGASVTVGQAMKIVDAILIRHNSTPRIRFMALLAFASALWWFLWYAWIAIVKS